MMVGIIIVAALAASLAGILLCWRGWLRGNSGWGTIAGAATAWAISTGLWIGQFGAEIGIPLALETAALIAFAFILTRIEFRPVQVPKERTAPALPRRNYWLGTARALVAGLGGFAAAIGIAMVFATRAPLAEQTRLILAALAVPSLWCAAIAWTVCDRRLLWQFLVFLGLAAASAGLTMANA